MLLIAMKSNCYKFWLPVYYQMCVDKLFIFLCPQSNHSGWFIFGSCPECFKSALVLIYTFKDCYFQVNPGHMNIFMKKNPQGSMIWFVCLVQSLLIKSRSCLVGFQVHFRQQCPSPFHTARWFRKGRTDGKLPECLLCERKHVQWIDVIIGYHDHFTGCFEGSSMLPTKKICANCNEAAIRKLLTVCPEAEIVRQFV